ncbi:HD family phosphohydrolase [Williamsia muralis]|uniref:HD family phosphohydrolase n=1 Tax=Williamsia marianensis TaxID=85044 RepID=UPI003815ACA9
MDSIGETEAVLRSLRGVWDEEAVDELDHALQAAHLATIDNADDELTLATALHDVGHSPLLGAAAAERHDRAAEQWLTPRFGPRVGWLAGAHVAAKRHLAATAPGYAGTLSGTSIHSLRAQGGATVSLAYLEDPRWPDALRLRRYDDAAKVPGAPMMSIGDLLDVARRVGSRSSS